MDSGASDCSISVRWVSRLSSLASAPMVERQTTRFSHEPRKPKRIDRTNVVGRRRRSQTDLIHMQSALEAVR
jgi:hypothetical protein